jgi:hypothetical protein
MATLNFAVNIPDDQVPRVIAALRYAFGDNTLTQAQLVEKLRENARDKIKSIVVNYERIQRENTLKTPVTPPDVT